MRIQIDEALFERIRELARSTGRTAEEAASDLLATLAREQMELDDEQADAVAEGFEQLDRGDVVSEADVLAKLKSLRG